MGAGPVWMRRGSRRWTDGERGRIVLGFRSGLEPSRPPILGPATWLGSVWRGGTWASVPALRCGRGAGGGTVADGLGVRRDSVVRGVERAAENYCARRRLRGGECEGKWGGEGTPPSSLGPPPRHARPPPLVLSGPPPSIPPSRAPLRNDPLQRSRPELPGRYFPTATQSKARRTGIRYSEIDSWWNTTSETGKRSVDTSIKTQRLLTPGSSETRNSHTPLFDVRAFAKIPRRRNRISSRGWAPPFPLLGVLRGFVTGRTKEEVEMSRKRRGGLCRLEAQRRTVRAK